VWSRVRGGKWRGYRTEFGALLHFCSLNPASSFLLLLCPLRLPYYINSTPIEGHLLTPKEAGDLSILFDIGGVAGGVMAGEREGCVCPNESEYVCVKRERGKREIACRRTEKPLLLPLFLRLLLLPRSPLRQERGLRPGRHLLHAALGAIPLALPHLRPRLVPRQRRPHDHEWLLCQRAVRAHHHSRLGRPRHTRVPTCECGQTLPDPITFHASTWIPLPTLPSYRLFDPGLASSLFSRQSPLSRSLCPQGNAKALATVTAIIDGMGSIGAAIGPMMTGYISQVQEGMGGLTGRGRGSREGGRGVREATLLWHLAYLPHGLTHSHSRFSCLCRSGALTWSLRCCTALP
jgi:hypothetical protein